MSNRRDRVRRAILKDEPCCRICAQVGESVTAVTVAPIAPQDRAARRDRAGLQPVCTRHAAAAADAAAKLRVLNRRLRMRAAAERGR